ncbi:MrcB family domain-containing protein [Acinetobacter courvalinii]|uniref:DUF3578 domain-containing protein n=1 Tax=Acinetobacter courvalinii TaxID=280147 RepID=A0AA42LA73_9GAMM|nr:DUF3578 domain-containing protein [Acinetobacter courvalinii]MDH0563784.1 DUF3578 domain-containing protein [Acinetobacter courvalinii]
MKEYLTTVLDHYLYAKQQPYNTNKLQSHYAALSAGITNTLENWTEKYANPQYEYDVIWSHGKGNWAEVPWVLCVNKAITTSAQRGYYLGILFSADMNSCVMGLLQGVTDAKQDDLTNFTALALEYIGTNSTDPNLKLGTIDLNATKDLGKKYQKYAIKSFAYTKEFLDAIDGSFIEKQFAILIKDYETLYFNAQKDITDLPPISNQSYQAIIQTDEPPMDVEDIHEGIEATPEKLTVQHSRHKRSKEKSRTALRCAQFLCEIDPTHQTFLTIKKRLYVEGHHLIPMSQQSNFNVSLDVTSNIVSLCPNCHTALHYGHGDIVREKLAILFSKRSERLKKQGLLISLPELYQIYIKKGLDQQYD